MPQRAFTYLVTLAFLLISAASAGATINKSIHVDDGERIDRKLSSVNGSINVGARAELEREARGDDGPWAVLEEVYASDLSQGSYIGRTPTMPAAADDEADFALRLIFQFNTSGDKGRLDNIVLVGTP